MSREKRRERNGSEGENHTMFLKVIKEVRKEIKE